MSFNFGEFGLFMSKRKKLKQADELLFQLSLKELRKDIESEILKHEKDNCREKLHES